MASGTNSVQATPGTVKMIHGQQSKSITFTLTIGNLQESSLLQLISMLQRGSTDTVELDRKIGTIVSSANGGIQKTMNAANLPSSLPSGSQSAQDSRTKATTSTSVPALSDIRQTDDEAQDPQVSSSSDSSFEGDCQETNELSAATEFDPEVVKLRADAMRSRAKAKKLRDVANFEAVEIEANAMKLEAKAARLMAILNQKRKNRRRNKEIPESSVDKKKSKKGTD